MRITGMNVYRVELPLHEGSYKWSGGRSVDVFDSTVVELETDAGIVGFGEVCPLGPAYRNDGTEGWRLQRCLGWAWNHAVKCWGNRF